MGFAEDFKKIVKEATTTKFKGDSDLAKKAKVAQSAVSMLNNNRRSGLQLETVGKLLDAIGAQIIIPEATSHPDHKEFEAKGLTILGVHAVAGAGPAWDYEESEPKFYIAVPVQYLGAHMTTLLISGESMAPTILDNAVVGVNRENTEIIQGKIYAVHLPFEGIVVKRLYIDHSDKCFILRSDNKNGEFPDIKLPFDEGDAFIYGSVEWVLQSYRKISF